MLHGYVVLKATEVDVANRLGLHPYSKNGSEHRFRQPCPCHDGKNCTIYVKRPNACRIYECKLLRAYTDGTKSFEASRALIVQAKELISSIKRHIGEDRDSAKSIWQQVEDFAKERGSTFESKEFRLVNRELALDLASLEAFCKQHFVYWTPDRNSNIK